MIGVEASAASEARPWVGIAANASSGLGSGRGRVDRLVAELDRLGFSARVAWTPEDRAGLVAQAALSGTCRGLVAAGGDGTVAALVNEQPPVPITVLKAGTENLFASHFGLSGRPERVAAVVAQGRTVRLDLGQTRGRRFTLMAGVGFDADVVSRHHLARVGRAGIPRPTHRGMYIEPVLRSSFEYRFPRLTVRVDDPEGQEEIIGTTAFVFNLPRYALGLPFAPSARGDDGWLDLVVFRKAGPFHALRYLWLVLRSIHLKRPGVFHRRVRRVTIASAETVPVQLDGDPGGSLTCSSDQPPWSVEVLPRAIEVIVPPAYADRQA